MPHAMQDETGKLQEESRSSGGGGSSEMGCEKGTSISRMERHSAHWIHGPKLPNHVCPEPQNVVDVASQRSTFT